MLLQEAIGDEGDEAAFQAVAKLGCGGGSWGRVISSTTRLSSQKGSGGCQRFKWDYDNKFMDLMERMGF